jgi:hypothetical protein
MPRKVDQPDHDLYNNQDVFVAVDGTDITFHTQRTFQNVMPKDEFIQQFEFVKQS